MYSALIVDDNEFSRNELKSMDVWGEQSGFFISAEAQNGREALQIVQQQSIDLVITDIRMPMIDGISLTETVLGKKLCQCVILISQFSYFEYARKGIHYGAFEYLLKPVDSAALLAALRRVAAYIGERQKELIKISYVDQIFRDQVFDFYLDDQIMLLIKSMKDGDPDSIVNASKIVDTIWFDMEFDLLKSVSYLTKAIQNLAQAVKIEFPWLNKLTKIPVKSFVFSEIRDIDALRTAFLDHVGQILSTLEKYELCHSSGIVTTACRYILENVDSPLSLNSLAKKLFISGPYLSTLFKQKTGLNLISYMTFIKMERARVLLEEGGLKSCEIAEKIGFNEEYFSKLFKKTYALSPSEYRKRVRDI